MGTKSKKKREPKNEVHTAAEAAKKVKALEQANHALLGSVATKFRSPIERRSYDESLSDDTTIIDSNVTQHYYEKYHDEKLRNIASKIEARSSEKLSQIKNHVTTIISNIKVEMLKWMIGTVIVIILGLIAFHFISLSNISAKLSNLYTPKIEQITNKINALEEKVTNYLNDKPSNKGIKDKKQVQQPH